MVLTIHHLPIPEKGVRQSLLRYLIQNHSNGLTVYEIIQWVQQIKTKFH